MAAPLLERYYTLIDRNLGETYQLLQGLGLAKGVINKTILFIVGHLFSIILGREKNDL